MDDKKRGPDMREQRMKEEETSMNEQEGEKRKRKKLHLVFTVLHRHRVRRNRVQGKLERMNLTGDIGHDRKLKPRKSSQLPSFIRRR